MIKTNIPQNFPAMSVSSYDVNGVRENYEQSKAEKPAEITVLPQFSLSDYPQSASKIVYVAPNGSDEADGSEATPFATVGKALSKTAGGGTVVLKGGTYSLDTPIVVPQEASGTEESPLFIMAAVGETPILTTGKTFMGSMLIKASEADFVTEHEVERLNRFTPDNAEHVYAVDLNKLGFVKEDFKDYETGEFAPCLFLEDEELTPARYPNKGVNDEANSIKNGTVRTTAYDIDGDAAIRRVGNVKAGISSLYYEHKDDEGGWEIYVDNCAYRDRLLAYDRNAKLWMYGAVYEEWDRINYPLTVAYEEGRPVMKSGRPGYYGAKVTRGNALYFFNMLEELDCEGEYLIDCDRLILYVYESPDMFQKTFTVAASKQSVITLENARRVVVSGLQIERTSGKGISLENCCDVLVQNCRFDNLGAHSVSLTECENCAVTYSDFYRCYGIIMSAQAHVKLMKVTGNLIQNNVFANAGVVINRMKGVFFGGVGDVVSHNLFRETTLYVGRALESILEYNEFDRGSQLVRDNGPIYTNDNSRGVHIRYNFLHNLNYALYGIYLDDVSSGLYVYGNVIHYDEQVTGPGKCVNVHGGNMNVVANNVCINATSAGVLNNLNYYAKTVNGEYTGGGGLGYRWESMMKDRLSPNFHYVAGTAMGDRYPMYRWYVDIVDRTIAQMNTNPDWDPSHKKSPQEDEELFTRKPIFNIYENNVFYACERGLDCPDIGRETCVDSHNVCYEKGTDVGFVDEDQGNFALREDSVIFTDIPDFTAPNTTRMGLVRG